MAIGTSLWADISFRNRMNAYRAVFEKTDRILSGKKVKVEVVNSGADQHLAGAPGWTNGETIFLNEDVLAKSLRDLMGKDIKPLMIQLKGVNYHELAHVLYTPRLSDDICQKVINAARQDGNDYRWWYAFNALEDQRIETWFTAVYSPASRYFEALALKWLVVNQQSLAESHVLVHGRKFLSTELRTQTRAAFAVKYGTQLADDFVDVIDQYLLVSFPNDTMKAFGLVKKFRDLLLRAAGMNMTPPDLLTADNRSKDIPDPYAQSSDVVTKGKLAQREQKNAARAAKDVVEKAIRDDQLAQQGREEVHPSNPFAPDQPPTPQQGSGDPNQGSGTDAGTADSDGSQGEPGGPKSDTPNDSVSQGTGGKGVSNAPGSFDPGDLLDDLLDRAYDDLTDIMQDENVQRQVDETVKSVRAALNDNKDQVQGQQASSRKQPPTSQNRSILRRVSHILEPLRLDLEPQWNHREPFGRLNIRRTMLRQPNEIDIFDRWDEGAEEEGGVEAVILVDMSGSMRESMTLASEALWIVKSALDKIEVSTTVLGYNNSHLILSKAGEKASRADIPIYGSAGSTNPQSALREALQVLARTHHNNRLLITITDGQWGGGEGETLALVRGIRALGTVTMLLGLDAAVAAYGLHGHEHGHDITSITQLPDITTKLVAGIMRNYVHNHV